MMVYKDPTLNAVVPLLPPQERRLLRHLTIAGSVSNVEANSILLMRSVSRRITTLRAALEGTNFTIHRAIKKDSNKQRYARYFLIKKKGVPHASN
jgi:hypothetical protein